MTRHGVKRLSLHRETLLSLAAQELRGVRGGGDEDMKNTYPISRCGYTCICVE